MSELARTLPSIVYDMELKDPKPWTHDEWVEHYDIEACIGDHKDVIAEMVDKHKDDHTELGRLIVNSIEKWRNDYADNEMGVV